jgi:hypothetical protein
MMSPPSNLPRKVTRQEFKSLIVSLPKGLCAYKIPEGLKVERLQAEDPVEIAIGDVNAENLWYYEETDETDARGESVLALRRYQWDPFAGIM